MKLRRSIHRLIATVSMAGISAPALACSVGATQFHFGTIDPLGSGATTSTSTLTVTCPSQTPYTVALSSGAGTYENRHMESGANQLFYNLYTDASYSNLWGDGTGSSQIVNGDADPAGSDHTIYGRVLHQPQAVPGSYADNITITVSY